jgi:hypothetical protein
MTPFATGCGNRYREGTDHRMALIRAARK